MVKRFILNDKGHGVIIKKSFGTPFNNMIFGIRSLGGLMALFGTIAILITFSFFAVAVALTGSAIVLGSIAANCIKKIFENRDIKRNKKIIKEIIAEEEEKEPDLELINKKKIELGIIVDNIIEVPLTESEDRIRTFYKSIKELREEELGIKRKIRFFFFKRKKIIPNKKVDFESKLEKFGFYDTKTGIIDLTNIRYNKKGLQFTIETKNEIEKH